MPDRKLLTACLVVLSLLSLAGCNSDAAHPPWALSWLPSQSARQTNPPQVAYTDSAYAQKPDGTLIRPAASVWLANGRNPAFGLALSQLDSAGQFYAAGIVIVDSGSRWWTLTDSITVARPLPGSGVPASQEESQAWRLPAGDYHSASIDVPDTPPGGSLQLWVSNTHREVVLARLYATILPPAAHTNIRLAGQSGWLATQGSFTVIALILDHGIYQGLGTLLFASNTNPQQSERLATQAAEHLNNLLPS